MISIHKRDSRVVAIIQARVGSSRLPGKVLLQLGNRPVLDWVVRAALSADLVDEVVIATTTSSKDDPIAHFGESHMIRVVRGSEQDVLSRYISAATESSADAIVRLTSDCPLLDPVLINETIRIWASDPHLDYVSTTQSRSLPRGMDVEVFSTKALSRIDHRSEKHHRSHVTSALYEPNSGFNLASLSFSPSFAEYRVTLDTTEDFRMLNALVKFIPDTPPSWRQVVQVLDDHPEVVAINSHVKQKGLVEG